MDYAMSTAEQAFSQKQPDMSAVGSARTFRVRRPGARPLVFNGTELAMAMSFTPGLPYWYELNVYRTDSQAFVLAVRLFFQSEDEEDRTMAWTLDTLPEVFDRLEAYDAARDIRMEDFQMDDMSAAELAVKAFEIKARMQAARSHFASLVGEFLAQLEASAGT